MSSGVQGNDEFQKGVIDIIYKWAHNVNLYIEKGFVIFNFHIDIKFPSITLNIIKLNLQTWKLYSALVFLIIFLYNVYFVNITNLYRKT